MPSVTCSREGDVAIIQLDRADAANAINHDLAEGLREVAAGLATQGWARAVLLRASGKMFSAGGDLSEILQSRADADEGGRREFFSSLVQGLHDAIRALRSIDAPVIAAVHGVAAGGGMSLALACDMILATPNARFVPAYPAIGLSTDGGMSWTLARAVGERKALQLLIDNRAIDAAEAMDIGIVSEILPGEDFDRLVMERAQRISQLPRRAIVGIRRLIEANRRMSFSDLLDLERQVIVDLYVSADAEEGLNAFAQRRSAKFVD